MVLTHITFPISLPTTAPACDGTLTFHMFSTSEHLQKRADDVQYLACDAGTNPLPARILRPIHATQQPWASVRHRLFIYETIGQIITFGKLWTGVRRARSPAATAFRCTADGMHTCAMILQEILLPSRYGTSSRDGGKCTGMTFDWFHIHLSKRITL